MVCLSVHVFLSCQNSQLHEILATISLIWANLKHDEARFFEILIFKGGWSPYGQVLKSGYWPSQRKMEISPISTHRTMTFWQSDYFYTKSRVTVPAAAGGGTCSERLSEWVVSVNVCVTVCPSDQLVHRVETDSVVCSGQCYWDCDM